MELLRPAAATTPGGKQIINPSPTQDGYLVSDGDNNRVLVGFDKDGFGTGVDYGIKVSQNGYDVLTASDDELVMSSAFNSFKIVASGSVAVSHTAGTSSITTNVSHGLGYVPGFLAYDYNGADYIVMPALGWVSGTSLDLMFQCWVNSSNISFYLFTPSTGGSYSANFTITAKYYLLRETAAL